MRTPTAVMSHCLARGPVLTPDILLQNLEADRELGFRGATIVAALINQEAHPPESFTDVFRETGMRGLMCGLNPGNGPDPLGDGADLCVQSLRSQARYAIALAEKGYGDPTMVGPMHTLHMKQRPTWPADAFRRWIDKVYALAVELNLTFLFEALNPVEDGTPDPFSTLFNAVRGRELLGLHFDTGHAHAHGLAMDILLHMAHEIGYLEFANVGREPLQEPMGIDFEEVVRHLMPKLRYDCLVGDEPFDLSVIDAFGLRALCTTKVPGPECLKLDANYLRRLGVMA